MRTPRRLAGGLLLAALAGCGATGTTDTTPEWVGVYALQSINGQALPFTQAVPGQGTETIEGMNLTITTTLATMALTQNADGDDNSMSCTFTPGIASGVNNIDFLLKTGPCATVLRYHHSGKTLTSVGGADLYLLTRP